MARPRLPVEVVQARGAKHLTKAEIQERNQSEVKPIADNIVATDYMTKKQKDEFYKISSQLQKLKIMGETDVDALARYITANDSYVHATKKLRTAEVKADPELYDGWSKIQERNFKMVRGAANDLGLTISSRCKLVVPEVNKEDTKKENKFKKFEKSVG